MPGMRTAILVVSLLWALPAHAHDHWLEAESTKVYLVMGKHFADTSFMPLRRRAEYDHFVVLSSAGKKDVLAQLKEDSEPIATLADLKGDGTYVIALDSIPGEIQLSAELFNAYLLEERLIDVLALRADRREEDLPARERYTRHMKTIVQRGAPSNSSNGLVATPIGEDLEIVCANPYTLAPGDDFVVTVLFKGKPLANRAVTAHNRWLKAVTRQTVRTDAQGRATFKLTRRGEWIFKLVHLEPTNDKDVPYRSYWSTLTFVLGDWADMK
jgi:hypothetical protein